MPKILDTTKVKEVKGGYIIWHHTESNEYYITGDGCNPYMAWPRLDQAEAAIQYIKNYIGRE